MPAFTYRAVDRTGRESNGRLSADSRAAAIDQVAALGLEPVSLNEVGAGKAAEAHPAHARRVSRSAVQAFTRELANLLAGGVPLSRALMLLSREAADAAARQCWTAIYEDVTGGSPLADALARWPRSFPPVYIAMVRAGETGGFLDMVLEQIADFQMRERDLIGRVKAALVYPAVLGVLAIVVVTFLLTFFIPRFSGIFADFGGALPLLTRAIVAASKAVTPARADGAGGASWPGGAASRRALASESGRRFAGARRCWRRRGWASDGPLRAGALLPDAGHAAGRRRAAGSRAARGAGRHRQPDPGRRRRPRHRGGAARHGAGQEPGQLPAALPRLGRRDGGRGRGDGPAGQGAGAPGAQLRDGAGPAAAHAGRPGRAGPAVHDGRA